MKKYESTTIHELVGKGKVLQVVSGHNEGEQTAVIVLATEGSANGVIKLEIDSEQAEWLVHKLADLELFCQA
jgi:hypothetical protein